MYISSWSWFSLTVNITSPLNHGTSEELLAVSCNINFTASTNTLQTLSVFALYYYIFLISAVLFPSLSSDGNESCEKNKWKSYFRASRCVCLNCCQGNDLFRVSGVRAGRSLHVHHLAASTRRPPQASESLLHNSQTHDALTEYFTLFIRCHGSSFSQPLSSLPFPHLPVWTLTVTLHYHPRIPRLALLTHHPCGDYPSCFFSSFQLSLSSLSSLSTGLYT